MRVDNGSWSVYNTANSGHHCPSDTQLTDAMGRG